MLKLQVLQVAVNHVRLGVNLAGHTGARIYRSRRASGPYEEVGLAFDETYDDTVHLEPGKTYFYLAVEWRAPSLYPETSSLREGSPLRVTVPRAQKERRFVLTGNHEEFTISMAGYLDESNTVTVGPEVYCPGPNSSMPPYDQAFEPNRYVAIENVGETDVENPWVVANGQRDWWSAETMAKEISGIAGGGRLSDRDKMMAIWKIRGRRALRQPDRSVLVRPDQRPRQTLQCLRVRGLRGQRHHEPGASRRRWAWRAGKSGLEAPSTDTAAGAVAGTISSRRLRTGHGIFWIRI